MSEQPVATITGRFTLEIPPDPDQVRTARLFAAAVGRHFALDEDRIGDLKVAISEAVTNSIKAHREAGIGEEVRVAADPTDDGLRFSVIDAGPGFTVPDETMQGNDPPTPATGLFEGSLGLTVIRSLFPKLTIERNPDRGMTVAFVVDAGSGEPEE